MIEILEGHAISEEEKQEFRQEDERRKVRLPKNIRQIGTPNRKYHIYMEDYVYTFLHPRTGTALRQEEEADTEEEWEKSVSILIGKMEQNEKEVFLFISGAVRVDAVSFKGDIPEFEDSLWEHVYQEMKRHFEEQDILGWALDMKGSPLRLTPEIEKLHKKYFGDCLKVLYIEDSIEKEEVFYIPSGQIFIPLDGYYIYYEKNTSMQEYMIHRKELLREKRESLCAAEAETVSETPVTAHEKKILEKSREHYRSMLSDFPDKTENIRWRMTIYTGSMVVIMIICAISVTLFNNYKKMRDLENVLAVLAEETEAGFADVEETVKVSSVSKDGAVIEEVAQTTEVEQQAIETTAGSEQAVTEQTSGEQVSDASVQPQAGQVVSGEQTADADTESGQAAVLEEAPVEQTAAPVQTEAEISLAQGYYVVQKGDNLFSISQKLYGTKSMAQKISEVNGIEDWDLIYAGQKLVLP